MAKEQFFLAKVLAKVYVHMSKFALYIFVLSIYYVLMFYVVKIIGRFFAKVLLKPWRKMAFLRKLGGLNCGLVVSELADEGEQGLIS